MTVGRIVGAFVLLATGLSFGEARSGYHYQSDEIRALQDDEFANPGMLWVDRGRELFGECRSCHRSDDLIGTATRYPLVRDGDLVNLEGQINRCRVDRLRKPPFEYESDELLSLTTFIANLSEGAPMAVAIDGAARPFFEAGEAIYRTRRGQLNLACHHCHVDHVGGMLRGDRLSEGQSVGYPIYRLDWQTQGSLHRRIETCFEGVRSETYPLGSSIYLVLELYLAYRARGLRVETPAVRR